MYSNRNLTHATQANNHHLSARPVGVCPKQSTGIIADATPEIFFCLTSCLTTKALVNQLNFEAISSTPAN